MKQLNEFQKMQKLAGLLKENQHKEMDESKMDEEMDENYDMDEEMDESKMDESLLNKVSKVLKNHRVNEGIEKYPPSNFKFLSKKSEKSSANSEENNTQYIYLLNNEDYTTPSDLTFNIKTKGYVLSSMGEKPNLNSFYYIDTDVYYNGKKIGNISGQKTYKYDVAGSINKAKRWLDKNGEDFVAGKKQFVTPST